MLSFVTKLATMRQLSMRQTEREQQFKQRFMPHYPALYRLALAIIGDSEEAADAVQDVMAKIWQLDDSGASVERPAAFASTLLRNVCLDRLRRRRPHAELNEVSATVEPVVSDTAYLLRAIDSLAPRQKEVMELSAFSDYSVEEIAQATGNTVGNVRQILSRTRRRLKEILKL